MANARKHLNNIDLDAMVDWVATSEEKPEQPMDNSFEVLYVSMAFGPAGNKEDEQVSEEDEQIYEADK